MIFFVFLLLASAAEANLALDVVFLHFLVEGGTADPKTLCRLAPVAPRLFKSLEDGLLFHMGQQGLVIVWCDYRKRFRFLGPISGCW